MIYHSFLPPFGRICLVQIFLEEANPQGFFRGLGKTLLGIFTYPLPGKALLRNEDFRNLPLGGSHVSSFPGGNDFNGEPMLSGQGYHGNTGGDMLF